MSRPTAAGDVAESGMGRGPTAFVLLAFQRTGSTWVMDSLHGHPNVVGYGELFIEGGRTRPKYTGAQDMPHFERFLMDSAIEPQLVSRGVVDSYLNRLYRQRSGVDAIGFKLMYGQAGSYPDVVDYVRENAVSIIHLVRRNLLDVIVSMEAAVTRGLFHTRSRDGIEPASVRLPVRVLVRRLEDLDRRVTAMRRAFSDSGIPYREVTYEELTARRESFHDLFAFLDVRSPQSAARSTLVKINAAPRRELISNYDAVEAQLAATRFKWMLDL